jgi:hypothetical protein
MTCKTIVGIPYDHRGGLFVAKQFLFLSILIIGTLVLIYQNSIYFR